MCPVRSQKGFEIDRDPGIRFSLAVDGPVEHRAAHERLHGARKMRDRTSTELAGADGILEQCAKLRAKLAGVGEGEAMKIGVGEVYFEEGEMIRQGLRSLCHLRHAAGDGFNRG